MKEVFDLQHDPEKSFKKAISNRQGKWHIATGNNNKLQRDHHDNKDIMNAVLKIIEEHCQIQL